MKLHSRWVAAAIGAALVVAGALALDAGAAHAVGVPDPAITGDPNAANGTIAFFDSTGNQITSGSLSAPFAAYAVASSATTRTGTIKATLFVATPDHTKANSLTWFNQQLTAASSWPLTGAPAGVLAAEGAGVPAVAIGTGDGDLAGAFAGAVNDPTTGYDHIMQIRMEDSGVGKPVQPPFWASDVWIDTAAGTWTQVYPAGPAPKTATSFSATSPSPAGPAPHGATVTLTSTLSAADSSHPAGSVHLFDGATDLGAAGFTAATGAVSATDTPADGSHSFTFKFTPTDTAHYTGTSSAPLSYTVNAATATSTTLTASPNGSATVGDPVTLTAMVNPSAATGSVQFYNGASAIGSPVAVSGGTASTTTSSLTVGSHSLTAKFLGTGAYAGSTSAAVAYQINPAPATSTSTSLGVSPSGPVDFDVPVTLTATVTPSTAVGSVQFYNGATPLSSPVTVSGGTASNTVTLSPGSHALTAKFLPTDNAAFGTSTSSAVNLTVNAEQTSTALTLSPVGPVQLGASVTLKATVTPSSAAGTVQFFDGASPLGTPAAVSGGIAQLTTSSLTVGSHSPTGQFTPTDTVMFTGSTSSAVSFTVQPASTAVALTGSPASPVVTGTPITLTATITPSAATGTVQFDDGGSPVGSAVAASGGTASATLTPALGSHSYTAVFTPTGGDYTGSTSSTSAYSVIPPPTKTSTSLTVAPAGPVDSGTTVTFTATVSPQTAGDPTPSNGTVAFKDGSNTLGSAPLSGGSASFTTSTLAGGSHSLTASYLPADATAFEGSSSAPTSITVNAQPTSITLTCSVTDKVTEGHPVSFTATLAPSNAAGTVTFTDGSSTLGSAPVSGGKASFSTSTLALGGHSVTAAFAPTDAAVFAPSSSAAVTLTVLAAPEVTGVSVGGSSLSPGGQLTPGSTLMVTAAGFQPTEQVSVRLGSSTLTTAQADAAGKVTATVTLPANLAAGAHTLVLHGSLADATFAFTVAASPTPTGSSGGGTGGETGSSGGGLASTGAQVAASLGLAVLLIAGGLALLLGARRRRTG